MLKERKLISATYDGDIPDREKIPAADGVIGIIAMLSYWGNGVDHFPEGVLPELFIDKLRPDGVVVIDVEGLTDLIGEVSKRLGREIGQLSVESLPVYLRHMRRGMRANGYGKMVPVEAHLTKKRILTIMPRVYQKDLELGLVHLLPQELV